MRKFLLAMFAVVATSSAADITDVLNQSVTGITGSSYTSFSGITVTSKAVYAGQCAGSYSSIQLRSNNSNSGIVTTASGGTITKVEVTWNSNTSANRTLQVYVSNTAFGDPTELYGGDATLAGTIVNDGSSTTLEIDGTYAYVGIRSASGAMYLDEVKFTWNDGQDVDTEAPEAPVITPEAGIYYGPPDVTITAEEGTEIYYTLNGGEETLYVAPFTLSETTKVEAVAKKGEHVSAKTSATFTIATVYTSLDDINRNTVDGNPPMKLVFDDLLVAYVNGSNTYVTDGEVGLLLFGTTDLTAGDRIKGSLTGTATLYNGLPEVKTSAAEIDAEVLHDGLIVERHRRRDPDLRLRRIRGRVAHRVVRELELHRRDRADVFGRILQVIPERGLGERLPAVPSLLLVQRCQAVEIDEEIPPPGVEFDFRPFLDGLLGPDRPAAPRNPVVRLDPGSRRSPRTRRPRCSAERRHSGRHTAARTAAVAPCTSMERPAAPPACGKPPGCRPSSSGSCPRWKGNAPGHKNRTSSRPRHRGTRAGKRPASPESARSDARAHAARCG